MFYPQFKKVRLRAMRESLRTIQTIWRERRKARAPLVLKKAKKKKQAARLFNANCILSCLFLPSLIAFARKTSSSFPQVVLPAFFSDILVGINC